MVLFGFRSLRVTAVSVLSCVLFEYIARKVMKRDNTIDVYKRQSLHRRLYHNRYNKLVFAVFKIVFSAHSKSLSVETEQRCNICLKAYTKDR